MILKSISQWADHVSSELHSTFMLYLGMVVLVLVSCAPATGQTTSSTEVASSQASARPVCLTCHDYGKVAKASANYVNPDKIKVNPHPTLDKTKAVKGMSSPHKSGQGVPDCTNCHEPHPQPPKPTDSAKANVDYCFGACHHQGNFTPCSNCHKMGTTGAVLMQMNQSPSLVKVAAQYLGVR